VVGVEPPPASRNVSTLSGRVDEADGEYAVQASAGSVDPHWTWFFNRAQHVACDGAPLNPRGRRRANQSPTAAFHVELRGLACNFTSTSSDPDGSIAGYQ